MKFFIAAILAGLLMSSASVFASDMEDNPTPSPAPNLTPKPMPEPGPAPIIGDPISELVHLTQCTATQVSLAHLELQLAASIVALSSEPTPELSKLADTYRTMSQVSHDRVKAYTDTLNTIIPEIHQKAGVDEEIILAKINQLVNKSIGHIVNALSSPAMSLEEQTKFQRFLMNTANDCETLAQRINDRHHI